MAHDDTSRQYLTFRLSEEIFALEIGKVREVLDFTRVTRVPGVPEFMLGVINLRSSVVPVIDMRRKFGMTRTESTVNTCIIITEVRVEGEMTIIGALADSVQEVIELEAAEIEPPPRLGTGLRTEFIRGMGKRDDRFVILLDLDRVFSIEDLTAIHESKEESATQVAN